MTPELKRFLEKFPNKYPLVLHEDQQDYIKFLEEANKDLKKHNSILKEAQETYLQGIDSLQKEIEELKNLNNFLKETQEDSVKKYTEELLKTETLKEEIEDLKRLHKIAFEKVKEYKDICRDLNELYVDRIRENKAVIDSTVVTVNVPKNRTRESYPSFVLSSLANKVPNK